jgi:transcriptional regulator with GAF, ATPase, and Fis domain
MQPGTSPTPESYSDAQNQETESPRNRVDQQIGVLREIAMEIVDQVEFLKGKPSVDTQPLSFNEEIRRFEIELIKNALFQTKGNQFKAAQLLGLKTTTLNSKIKRYGLSPVLFVKLSERHQNGRNERNANYAG